MICMIASDFIACFMFSEILSMTTLLAHKGEHFQLKRKRKTKEVIGQVVFLKVFQCFNCLLFVFLLNRMGFCLPYLILAAGYV